MSDNKITRDVYRQYAKKIVNVLDGEDFYLQFKKRVDKGANEVKLSKKRLIQDISIDWIDTIEEILPNLDTIVRNPRKFIVQEEDIVDVSLARSISTESVKYLAQHTNMISKVDKDGSVTPSKILNITKEESFEIYENRFIYTLLLKLKDFVTMRYDKIKRATATQDVLDLEIESRFNLPSKKVTYRTEYLAQLSFDEVMRLDPDTLTKIERVAKIDRIITDFLSSSFAKSMRNSAPVRPPIMRTNVILKEPNFKKALTLWQFVETYNQTAGFSTSDEVDEIPVDNADTDRLKNMVTLNTMLFESIYDQFETDMDMEDKEFADFLRVGDMDFQKDNIDRDEYAQKLDNEIKDQEEEEKVEEVKATENQEAETELEPPPPEEKEKEEVEVEKVVEKEVVVEKVVEVEKFKELPPKDMDEQPDLEPDADTFDQHLFEVRKLFKRPDDDKIKQEEIIKVKDAIDRCLTTYRRIKQEELEERDRQERIRRRKLDIEKRAAAFRKQRDAVVSGELKPEDSVYFGIDPFAAQRAKIEEEKKQKQREEEAAKLLAKKNERLDLDNPDIEGVQKEIAEMEAENKKRKKRNAKIDKGLDTLDAMMPIEGEENMRFPKYAEPQEAPEDTAEDAPKAAEEPKQAEQESKPKAPRKQKIRISKDENSVDPWAKKQPKAAKNIVPVDESKVQVGGINLRGDAGFTPWGEGTISMSNLAEKPAKIDVDGDKPAEKAEQAEQKPKKPRKPRAPKKVVNDGEKPVETPQAEEKPVEEPKAEEPKAEAKPRKPRKPKEPKESTISPTTLNQKYSKPSGKSKNITAVDESKLQLGGFSGLDDPWSLNVNKHHVDSTDEEE